MLVLAILALLTVVSITASIASRLEIQASHNFARSVQANMSAATGVTSALNSMVGRQGPISLNQPWARPRRPAAASFVTEGNGRLSADDKPTRANSDRYAQSPEIFSAAATFRNVTADIRVVDECGKINVNAAGRLAPPGSRVTGTLTKSGEEILTGACDLDLTAALEQLMRSKGVASTQAGTLVRAIVLYRYGPDGKPGAAGVDDNLNGGSTSQNPAGDGFDNDLDGTIDNPEEKLLAVQSNGIDDNGDGVVDDAREGLEFNGLDDNGNGVVDEPGDGVDEPAEFIGDLRLPCYGDDRRYQTVEDLLLVPGMTPEIFNALRHNVTVFSCSSDRIAAHGAVSTSQTVSTGESVSASEGVSTGTERRPLNTAAAAEIEAHLRLCFPKWDVALARQFAADIVDWRDPDRVPTRMPDIAGRPALGVEITPYINEVWPDSATDSADGDDGQFVELYNPYPETIRVEGWRLRVGATAVPLDGVMLPGSYLIVTDDYKGDGKPARQFRKPEYGTFYDIFGLIPNGSNRRLIEDSSLNLPDDEGEVCLLDEKGNLIDFFDYAGGTFDGVRLSFQRNDPRVRYSERLRPTPFERNANFAPPAGAVDANGLFAAKDRDRPFVSVGEIMRVSSAFVSYTGLTDADGRLARALWSSPELKNADGAGPDIRLLDAFCLAPRERFKMPLDGPYNMAKLQNMAARFERADGEGRINVNTAPREVLAAIDLPFGDGSTFADRVSRRRDALTLALLDRRDGASAPFERISDVFLDEQIFSGLTPAERLDAAVRLTQALATDSRSFGVASSSRENEPGRPAGGGASRRIEATVADSRIGSRIVTWRYIYPDWQ